MNKADCAVCGKFVGVGSGVVLHFGKGGRVHLRCLAEGKVTLANGQTFSRPTQATGNAATGTLRDREKVS